MELVGKISQMWDDLFTEARSVDQSLKDVKKSFTVVRQQAHKICFNRR